MGAGRVAGEPGRCRRPTASNSTGRRRDARRRWARRSSSIRRSPAPRPSSTPSTGRRRPPARGQAASRSGSRARPATTSRAAASTRRRSRGTSRSAPAGPTSTRCPVVNSAYRHVVFWNGRADSLWALNVVVPESTTTMNGNRLRTAHRIFDALRGADFETVVRRIDSNRSRPIGSSTPIALPARAASRQGRGDRRDGAVRGRDDVCTPIGRWRSTGVLVNWAKAIAAYEYKLISGDSPISIGSCAEGPTRRDLGGGPARRAPVRRQGRLRRLPQRAAAHRRAVPRHRRSPDRHRRSHDSPIARNASRRSARSTAIASRTARSSARPGARTTVSGGCRTTVRRSKPMAANKWLRDATITGATTRATPRATRTSICR